MTGDVSSEMRQHDTYHSHRILLSLHTPSSQGARLLTPVGHQISRAPGLRAKKGEVQFSLLRDLVVQVLRLKFWPSPFLVWAGLQLDFLPISR